MFRLRDLESAGSASLEPEATTVTVKSHDPDSLLGAVPSTKRIIYTTTRPTDIKTPYDKMLENEVEFGSPDKRSGGFLQSALAALFYIAVLAAFLQRFPINFSQVQKSEPSTCFKIYYILKLHRKIRRACLIPEHSRTIKEPQGFWFWEIKRIRTYRYYNIF